MNWNKRLKKWLVPRPATPAPPQVPPGVYHYQRERDGGYMRFHLRVEADGEALLLAGAAEAVRLSAAGARAAKSLLDGVPADDVADELKAANAPAIVAEVAQTLDELGRPSARYPTFNLSDPLADDRQARLMAPFQADVAVGDLDTLREILGRLWEAGVPHARFRPGDGVETETVVRAVERAEDLGMIAGIRACGAWLHHDDRVKRMAEVGLDYAVIPWGVTQAAHTALYGREDHDALPGVIDLVQSWEMTPVLEIPLLAETFEALHEQLSQLDRWSVANAELFAVARPSSAGPGTNDSKNSKASDNANASESESSDAGAGAALGPLEAAMLRQAAAWIEETADLDALQLVWLPPVACPDDSRAAELARRGPRAGGDVSIRVEADGSVFPPRGPQRAAGNLLNDSWDAIWSHDVFLRFRERVEANTRCDQCPGLAVCAADCPADQRGWARE